MSELKQLGTKTYAKYENVGGLSSSRKVLCSKVSHMKQFK